MDHPEGYGAGMRWLAVLAYAVQMFGDFAGYSAMAIGLGRLFALELPENFNFPFISKSMMEFWRRWHITLNTWLFDYVYGPMTMSRGWWRGHLDVGFLVVFGLCGLWHGAAWGFVAWGLLHAAALVVERRWGQFYKTLCRRDRVWVTRRRSWWYATLAWGLTQLWFVITLVPFRLHEPSALGGYLWGMLTATGDKVPPGLEGLRQWQHLAVIGLFMLLYHGLTRPTGQKLQEGFLASPVWVRGVLYGLVLIYLFIFSPLSEGTFVYADF
jgi:D-alanyl-lipoteichoic acid acyltransferase DltB (MBOAT superfamily)